MLVDRPGHKIVWLSLLHPSWLELACMVCETPSQVSRKWAHTVSQARPPRPTSPARHAGSTVCWERMWRKSAIPGSGSGGS